MKQPSVSSFQASARTRTGSKATVLIADDDVTSLQNLGGALRESGFTVMSASSGLDAIVILKTEPIDVVVSDVRMENLSGMDVLKHVSAHSPETAVILVTGYGSIESAVEAMRSGAYDYLSKPVDINKLELLIVKAVQTQKLLNENVHLKRQLSEKYSFGNIVGRSAPMRRIFREIEQVAKTNATVLIRGESGTGKELIASALHHHSTRADRPLVKINCVALVENLVESELFGHEKGSFTGAYKTRKGRIELADGGSLFLDEIGDLGQSTQLKLLRVLQEREIERVGSNLSIPVDVRVIGATNKDLEKEVAEERFREELYYRIKVVSICIPPLRDRAEDIPLLVDYFIRTFNREHRREVHGFSPAAMRVVVRHFWPGNVRELRNIVESLVVMARKPTIEENDLPQDMLEQSDGERALIVPVGIPLSEAERQVILGNLRLTGGNKSRAARILGISKKTLYRKLKEYGALSEEPEQRPKDR